MKPDNILLDDDGKNCIIVHVLRNVAFSGVQKGTPTMYMYMYTCTVKSVAAL